MCLCTFVQERQRVKESYSKCVLVKAECVMCARERMKGL